MEFKDIKIGMKLEVVYENLGMEAKCGDIVTVSDLNEHEEWVYIEGNDKYSGKGQCASEFKPANNTIDWDQPVETMEGVPVNIITKVGRNKHYPVLGYIGDDDGLTSWTSEGVFYRYGESSRNLRNVKPKPVKFVGYVNIYNYGEDKYSSGILHATRLNADQNAHRPRISCIKVEFEEGQFDD